MPPNICGGAIQQTNQQPPRAGVGRRRREGGSRSGAGRATHVGAGAEGLDSGDDVDGDAEQRGGHRDDAEAAADDEERVGAGARGPALPLPRRAPAPASAGMRRGGEGGPGPRRRRGGRIRHGLGFGFGRFRWAWIRRAQHGTASGMEWEESTGRGARRGTGGAVAAAAHKGERRSTKRFCRGPRARTDRDWLGCLVDTVCCIRCESVKL